MDEHRRDRWSQKRRFVVAVVWIACFVAITKQALFRLCRLPETAYADVFPLKYLPDQITIYAAKAPNILLFAAIVAAILLAGSLIRHNRQLANTMRALSGGWQFSFRDRNIRTLAIVCVVILVWRYVTADYNLFFDRAYYYDRIAIVLLGVSIWWRPIFIVPFLVFVTAFAFQFGQPLGNPNLSQASLPIAILLGTSGLQLFNCTLKRRNGDALVFVAACAVAAGYWVPGTEKLLLGQWFSTEHVANLLPASYASGWLSSLTPETVGKITSSLDSINVVLLTGTILVECGSILFFFHRRIAKVLLLSWPAFHVGIAALTGILFWQWIILDVVLLLLFFRGGESYQHLFRTPAVVLSVFLIGLSSIWMNPHRLAWYSVPVSYSYRVYATDTSGNDRRLGPPFFSPYEYAFAKGGFRYLGRSPLVPVTWGVTRSGHVANEVRTIENDSTLRLLEASLGEVYADSAAAELFRKFTFQYVTNLRNRGSRETFFSFVKAPPDFLTLPLDGGRSGSTDISSLTVRQVVSLFHEGTYREIRDTTVLQLQVQSLADLN